MHLTEDDLKKLIDESIAKHTEQIKKAMDAFAE